MDVTLSKINEVGAISVVELPIIHRSIINLKLQKRNIVLFGVI